MTKFTFVMEDVSGEIELLGSNNYILKAKDEDGNSGTKEVTAEEAMSVLFCSVDPAPEIDYWGLAQKVQEGFPVQLIP